MQVKFVADNSEGAPDQNVHAITDTDYAVVMMGKRIDGPCTCHGSNIPEDGTIPCPFCWTTGLHECAQFDTVLAKWILHDRFAMGLEYRERSTRDFIYVPEFAPYYAVRSK